MIVRRPAAAHFYAGDCARATERFLRGFSAADLPARITAAVVPHAGWEYSGAVAARVFESIRRQSPPETFVVCGAVHRWSGGHAVYARGAWATPLGEVAVDEALAAQILQASGGLASDNAAAHDGEHSIEVELPFIKHLFPQAKVVPVAVCPEQNAVALGQRIAQVLRRWPHATAVIGSTDLTHYGDMYHFTPAGYGDRAREWMRENDARILRLAEQMRAEEIVPEALRHHNACGPGALAATVAAAAALGCTQGRVIHYTTSFDVVPEREFRMAVGYAGILF
ncbi:MAG TPA: AmmeMemoRadiSam system protein B [Terriglobia bacterium]|nr:AmmeMemoRadiSam system protein B [Terriglobia bacterium]